MTFVDGNAHLAEVIGTLRAGGRFAHFEHGRREEPDQGADEGNDHQEFHPGEGAPLLL
jgi:hypothetical protein